MSTISAVSSAQTYTPPQQIQAAQVKPAGGDSDGDHDNDATESAASKAQESGKVNVLA
jgi:hypothetical protein